jgi:hypothetical protein
MQENKGKTMMMLLLPDRVMDNLVSLNHFFRAIWLMKSFLFE